MDVLVYGFYNRNNLGDDSFQITVPKMFPDFKCTFICSDDFIWSEEINKYKAIIVGPGDVYNEYFLSRLENIPFKGLIIGLGVGISYSDDVYKYYKIFDHIFLREKADLYALSTLMGCKYVHYLPDLAFHLPPQIGNVRKGIGAFLATPLLLDPNYLPKLRRVFSKYRFVTLYCFNTNSNPNENDLIINKKILAEFPNYVIDDTIYSVSQFLEIFGKLELAICSRFHAHIFALISHCPIVSVSGSRKVELLFKDLDISDPNVAEKAKFYLSSKQVNNIVKYGTKRFREDVDLGKLTKELLSLRGAPGWERVAAEEMCFSLTNSPGSQYLWGTNDNLRKTPDKIPEMVSWIHNDILKSRKLGFDFEVYNQNNLQGYHRAGWSYVTGFLKMFSDKNGIIFDTFADRSFLWGRWILTRKGILPYTSYWIGIFHHCPNEEYTENNSFEIVRSKEFQQSLPTCLGIICLSEYLSNWFRERVNVPVHTLYHPTLFVDKLWKPEKKELVNIGAWYRNPFSIYQIETSWKKRALRGKDMNSYFPPNKVVLTSEQINNPDSEGVGNKWVFHLSKYLQSQKCTEFNLNGNKPIEIKVRKMIASVEIIDQLGNDDYDNLLSQVVVFLDLVDASAANTIIECIVRNTPIIVNRHPAVVEYLGSEYPLFYTSLDEVPKLLNNVEEAWKYLRSLNKTHLQISYFLDKFASIKWL